MLHLYWPSMIYENEECAGNVLYTICAVDVHDEPSYRAVCLHDLWDELRNAGAGKAMALDGPDEGTCIGRVASPVEDPTSTILACLSEDERHQR